jgi:hypothetical protein
MACRDVLDGFTKAISGGLWLPIGKAGSILTEGQKK